MGVGALIAWLARNALPANLTPLYAAMIAAPIAGIGIVSDLVESIIKRRAAIIHAIFPDRLGAQHARCRGV